MTEELAPFAGTQPPLNGESEPKQRNRRERTIAVAPAGRKPGRPRKNDAPHAVTDEEIKAAVVRKKRGPKPAAAQAEASDATLSAAIVASIGLKQDESELLARIVQAVTLMRKPSRDRVLVALGKIFA